MRIQAEYLNNRIQILMREIISRVRAIKQLELNIITMEIEEEKEVKQ